MSWEFNWYFWHSVMDPVKRVILGTGALWTKISLLEFMLLVILV